MKDDFGTLNAPKPQYVLSGPKKKSPQEELFMIRDGFSLSHHHDHAIFLDTLHEDFCLHASLLHERPCLPYVHVVGTETVHIARASRPL